MLELRVYSARGILTSTQIEAVASVVDELAGTRIELAPGEIVLYDLRRPDMARAQTLLAEAGLRTVDTSAAPVASEQPRAEPGLQHVELPVAGGRITPRQLRDLARLARTYADCELRITASRNLVLLNTPRANLSLLLREPVLRELGHEYTNRDE